MRITFLLVSALFTISRAHGQQYIPDSCVPVRSDAYWVTFVSSAFDVYKAADEKGVLTSQDTNKLIQSSPSLYELGDAVSVATLKIFTLEELAKPENAGRYLTITRISFADRKRVAELSDQEPRVTLLVLEFLERREASEPVLEKRIAYMKRCTRDFSCSTRGDFDSAK